jgi:hypothetical protein
LLSPVSSPSLLSLPLSLRRGHLSLQLSISFFLSQLTVHYFYK